MVKWRRRWLKPGCDICQKSCFSGEEYVARVLVVWWVVDGACVGFWESSMFGWWGDGGRRTDRRSTMLGGGFRHLIWRHRRDRGNEVGRWRQYATVMHNWRRWVVRGDGWRLGCGWCALLIVVDARLGFIGEVVVGFKEKERRFRQRVMRCGLRLTNVCGVEKERDGGNVWWWWELLRKTKGFLSLFYFLSFFIFSYW